MGNHSRRTALVTVIGVLALGGTSAAWAQDTSAAARQDTSSYQAYPKRMDTTQAGQNANRADSSGSKYNGPSTDTAFKAKPGVQTGPSANDNGRVHHHRRMRMSAMDTVVCKDGSNSANSSRGACGSHGGVDTAATWAAMRARGWQGKPGRGTTSDTTSSGRIRPSGDSSASGNRSSP